VLFFIEIYQSKNSTPLPVKWCAPEVLKSEQFSSASDRYALGITLWEIFNKGLFWSSVSVGIFGS
jgi:serine/threonine protein kinase